MGGFSVEIPGFPGMYLEDGILLRFLREVQDLLPLSTSNCTEKTPMQTHSGLTLGYPDRCSYEQHQ